MSTIVRSESALLDFITDGGLEAYLQRGKPFKAFVMMARTRETVAPKGRKLRMVNSPFFSMR